MAKYAYAPLSIEGRRKDGEDYHSGPSNVHDPHAPDYQQNAADQLVQERMPLCVGVCVLLAIVFVLSRTGENKEAIYSSHENIRAAAVNGAVPASTAPNNNYNANVMTTPSVPTASSYGTYTGTDYSTKTTSSSSSYGTSYGGTNYGGTNYGGTAYGGAPSGGDGTTSSSATAPASFTSSGSFSATDSVSTTPECNCPEPSSDINGDPNAIMAKLRNDALQKTPPHIIECSKAERGESQDACHLPSEDRFAALGQKGATIWMTGCSGAGKTTIATALEELLVKKYKKHVYRLDGDNLRTGINRDLGFSESDRAESVRRTGELATLFSDAGVITLVGLISPYRADRDMVRQRHEQQNIPFYEVFLDVPVDELKNRDPKGQYARVESGELKHFTCIDDPYEEPLHPEITLKTHELRIEDSVHMLLKTLENDGILIGPPKVAPKGLPNPDGDKFIDLHIPPEMQANAFRYAQSLPKVLITDIDLNWLQTIGEGWVAPLKGFMREGTLLETLHFNSILVDPMNVTGNVNRLETKTDFANFPPITPTERVSMPIPITLSITSFTKDAIESSGQMDVALSTRMGQIVAIMKNVEIYNNRKEEIVTRMYGVIDFDHPYISNIYSGGDYLIGGELELIDRIKYNDGLDQWRKTVKELVTEFEQKGADTVYAFQTRNPTHAGHAYLMRSAGEDLRSQGYKKPVLWLSPLGGWTKSDDVPLDVRVRQHEQVLQAGTTHPGGLDPETTVMAIWPAPMVYAGPTEVQLHAKSRRCAGASYFVVGRDPAGMKGSPNALAHADDDLYDGDHGRYVLQNSPGIGNMEMLSFVKVMYDITDNVMKEPDPSRLDDFISISGTKMRSLARSGAVPCPPDDIPTDLEAANCIPSGFMVPNGWETVVDYYKNIEDSTRWIPWSQPFVPPPIPPSNEYQFTGRFGSTTFELTNTQVSSMWHDIRLHPNPAEKHIINMVTEIPMYVAAKMEVMKDLPNNPIGQDSNKDGSARYYTYGTPFFNYGFAPQTWEDPHMMSETGHGGDNDPVDVMEFGSLPLYMGSVTPCKILGSLELIDEGETDHKILCIAMTDPMANSVNTIYDLDASVLQRLIDWLKRYKTSDGKPENSLASETPKTIDQAMGVLAETHNRWKKLCGKDESQTSRYSLPESTRQFWLDSPNCRGS